MRASGATVAGTGTLGANLVQLPLNVSRNSCGNSGITCYGSDRRLKTAVTPVVWER